MASSLPDQNHPADIEDGLPSSHPAGGGSNYHQHYLAPDPSTGYTPATGYPPTMGYPAYNCNNYNPNCEYGAPQQLPKQKKISGLLRGITGGLIFFIFLACIFIIITWLILHPETPIFHVSDLIVSDFNVSSSSLTANWVANVSARNPNERLDINFDEIDAYMVYDDEYLVASSPVKPFAMKKRQNATMVVPLSAANNRSEREDSNELKEKEMEKMATERNSSGKVRFELRMMLWGTYKAGNWWARHVLIKVFCENLEIGFLNKDSSNGSLADANSLSDCLVTV